MVREELTDGRRIAELLASEIDGRKGGPLGRLTVTNPDREVEGTPDGERAYDVRRLRADRDPRREPAPEEAGRLFAQVFVHEDRARIELRDGLDAAAERAAELDLRVRPKAIEPPRTLVFVEQGAAVKRAVDVLEAAADATESSTN